MKLINFRMKHVVDNVKVLTLFLQRSWKVILKTFSVDCVGNRRLTIVQMRGEKGIVCALLAWRERSLKKKSLLLELEKN